MYDSLCASARDDVMVLKLLILRNHLSPEVKPSKACDNVDEVRTCHVTLTPESFCSSTSAGSRAYQCAQALKKPEHPKTAPRPLGFRRSCVPKLRFNRPCQLLLPLSERCLDRFTRGSASPVAKVKLQNRGGTYCKSKLI